MMPFSHSRRIGMPAAAVVVLALAACGSTTAGSGAADSGNGTGGSPGASAGASPSGAAGSTTTVGFSATLYDRTSPCASVTGESMAVLAVPKACAEIWIYYGALLVPGPDIINGNASKAIPVGSPDYHPPPYPNKVTAVAPVSAADAKVRAAAFVRDQALAWFAAQQGYPVLSTFASGNLRSDGVNLLVKEGDHFDVPKCAYPTAIRAVNLDSAAQSVVTASYPTASSTGFVLTFPACPAGLTVHLKSGSTTNYPLNPTASNVVATGAVRTDATFGAIWIMDGEAQCGPAALKAICP